MKKQLVAVGLSSVIALSACGTNEEASNEENGEATQKAKASSDDSSSNNEEMSEADSEETSDRYEKLHKTMTTFSLPEKGRLTNEEAEERFGGALNEGDSYEDVIVYDNSMFFDKETKASYRHSWLDYESLSEGNKAEPYGTQALGSLKFRINNDMTYYPSIFEEHAGTPLKDLDEYEGVKKSQIESGELEKDGEGINPTGYEAIEVGSDRMLTQLYQHEPYVEQFDAVHDWAMETIGYFEEAGSYDEDEWKEAYKYYKKGVDNIDEMEKAINE